MRHTDEVILIQTIPFPATRAPSRPSTPPSQHNTTTPTQRNATKRTESVISHQKSVIITQSFTHTTNTDPDSTHTAALWMYCKEVFPDCFVADLFVFFSLLDMLNGPACVWRGYGEQKISKRMKIQTKQLRHQHFFDHQRLQPTNEYPHYTIEDEKWTSSWRSSVAQVAKKAPSRTRPIDVVHRSSPVSNTLHILK